MISPMAQITNLSPGISLVIEAGGCGQVRA